LSYSRAKAMELATVGRDHAGDDGACAKCGMSKPDEIRLAAERVFYHRGYSASRIKDIADQVGMLPGSLYYHIDSKEGLLFDIIYTVYEQAIAGMYGAL